MARSSWLTQAADGLTLLLLAVVLVTACAPSTPIAPMPTPQPPASLAPAGSARPVAKSGGTVTVYSALSEEMNGAIKTAFERAQPVIALEILTLAAAGDLEAHVRAEKDSPRVDILLGGSSEYHDSLGKAGLLEAYKPTGAAPVDADLKDPAGFWTGWYLGVLGIAVNTERVRASSVKAMPASWDDLLDPALKGEIVMPDPLTTGAGYIFLANQYFRSGRDESRAMDYLKKFHANVATYTGTAPLAIDEVGKGNSPVGVNWGHDVLTAASKGQPLKFVAPEYTAYEVGAVSIVKGGPNPVGARAFVDWTLSREAAEVVVKLSNRISVLKRVETTPGAPTLDAVKLVDYDRAWATANKQRLLNDWRLAVGR